MLNDGTREAIISGASLNFLSDDGEWTPIEARFAPKADGFAAMSNTLKVQANGKRALFTAQTERDHAIWQPSSFVVVTDDGERVIARAKDGRASLSSAGDTIRYANGWTLPTLNDEVVVRPSAVEHNVIFAERPAREIVGDGELVMRAVLRIPTGLQVFANGSAQTAAFETSDSIELRDAQRATQLVLKPASVFEQGRPHNGIVARYRFLPIDGLSWSVEMRTPLAWWSDVGRQFPVVWDPAFAQVGNVQVQEVSYVSATNPAPCDPWSGKVSVGHDVTCEQRAALVKFNGLSPNLFPPGYVIERAQLVFAPDGGFAGNPLQVGLHRQTYADVFAVTGAWTSNWPGPTTGALLCSSRSLNIPNDPNSDHNKTNGWANFCDIQNGGSGLVSDWINGAGNNGVLFRQASNYTCPYYGCAVVTFPTSPVWQTKPASPLLYFDPALKGVGFALVIHYRGPTLPINEPYTYEDPTPKPPVAEGNVYQRSYHGYNLPFTAGAEWTAVAVKGFRKSLNIYGTLKPGLFSYAYWAQNGEPASLSAQALSPSAPGVDPTTAYAFPMSIVKPYCPGGGCVTKSIGNGSDDGSNFLLAKGNVYDHELRIDAIKPDPNLEQYAVEVAPSIPLPALDQAQIDAGGQKYTYSFAISTTHIITAFHLNFLANTRMGIGLFTRVNGLDEPTASVSARLFRPTAQSDMVYAKTESAKTIAAGKFERQEVSSPALSGTWGIVLELPGDNTAFDACGECDADLTPLTRTIEVDLVVQACPLNAVPTSMGCDEIVKPNGTEPPSTWQAVGPFWIFSPQGFTTCGSYLCTNRILTNGNGKTSLIIWAGMHKRALIIAGDQIRYQGNFLWLGTDSIALLGVDPPDTFDPIFELFTGYASAGNAGQAYGYLYKNGCFRYGEICNAGRVLTDYDISQIERRIVTAPTLRVNLLQANDDSIKQYAEITATVQRPIATQSGLHFQQFTLYWRVQAEGYAGWDEPGGGNGPLNVTLTPLNAPAPAPVSSLSYRFSTSWQVNYDTTSGKFDKYKNDNGKVQQPANMGSAWTYADYVVLPFGESPDGDNGVSLCGGFCGDVRNQADTFASPNRTWRMPDILINNAPQTVMVQQAGKLEVFSTDHPDSLSRPRAPAGARAPNVDSVGFSFKTFNANVKISEKACPGQAGNIVTVIEGTTGLELPCVGKDEQGRGVTANFILCAGALRQVSLTFNFPPGIPIAQPPVMYVDMIRGTVDIFPEYAKIQVDVGFYMGAAIPKLYKGVGSVIIDTRGLFEIQTTGKVLGMMDADGRLWVAWSQMDLGFNVQGFLPTRDDWVLKGGMYAHLWTGQGWQNRYSWLPNDNQLHMTARYQADFKIKEGMVVDEWPFVLPPDDITVGIELAFGQFCANESCSASKWGIKGKVEILGYDVGGYVDLECIKNNPEVLAGAAIFPPAVFICVDLILGSDNHILIDQFGGLMQATDEGATLSSSDTVVMKVNGRATALNRRGALQPSSPDSDEVLPTVTASTNSFMVALGWLRGYPQFSLIRPDATEITVANAESYGVVVTTTSNMVMFGVQSPMLGVWQARVTNATPDDNWKILYFSNKVVPPLNFTAPSGSVNVYASGDGSTSQFYTIQWTPPPDASNLRLSLFYSLTNAGELTTTQTYGGVITENLDPSLGSFNWDVSFLRSGDYRVWGTLQDAVGAQVTPTGTNQYVGNEVTVAPGTLHYTDAIAPAHTHVGTIFTISSEDGVVLCWQRNGSHDITAYRLRFFVSDFLSGLYGRFRDERVLAVDANALGAKLQSTTYACVRIGGLVPGESSIHFNFWAGSGMSSIDSSGNESGGFDLADFSVPTGGEHDGPLAGPLSGTVNTADGSVVLSWTLAVPYFWDVHYAREAPAGINVNGTGAVEGNSPINFYGYGYTQSTYTLHGLTPGYWHSFAVRGRDFAYSTVGPLSNRVWLLVTDGVDNNANGCPDDWEGAHSALSPAADPDLDGLQTATECAIGTDPQKADTDEDTWIDGEEVFYGTDPLDPLSYPDLSTEAFSNTLPLPRLSVGAEELKFVAFQLGPNPPTQQFSVTNNGGNTLTPSLNTDAPWTGLSLVGDAANVSVNKSGLAPGMYTGVITVTAQPTTTLATPQTVQVRLRLWPGRPNPKAVIFVPLAQRVSSSGW